MFILDANRRRILAITVGTINIILILLGILITGGSLYIGVKISRQYYSEKAEVMFVFTTTGIFGTHVIIIYLVGVRIGDRCYNYAFKKSTGRQLQLWGYASINTSVNLVLISVMCSSASKHIVRSLRHSLEKGLHSYLKDPNWKRVIDVWQFTLQCCGIVDHTDWHKIVWLNKIYLNLDHPVVQQFRLSSERLLFPSVPWSCCKVDFPMDCFHDPLQQANARHLWTEQPAIVADSLNSQGCLNVLRQPIENALALFILVTFFVVVFQIALLCSIQILYTSCKNSIILGDPDGSAPGWIFRRNFFSSSKNRTLSEIMMDFGVQTQDIPRYQLLETETVRKKGTPSSMGTSIAKSISRKLGNLKAKISERGVGQGSGSGSRGGTSDVDPVSSGEEEALMLK